MLGWKKHKLELRLLGSLAEIAQLGERYTEDCWEKYQ